MPYQDNLRKDLYGGERYNEARVPDVRAPQVAQAVSNDIVMRGIGAMARNLGEFGEVLQKRYKNKRDNENQLNLQQIEAERKAELNRRFDLPNGAEGSFYDKDGNLDLRAVKQFNEEYMRRARQTNTGYATPWDKEERDTYLRNYEAKCTQETEAAALASVKKRGLQAFEDSYELSLLNGDSASAAQAAVKAWQNDLFSKDRRDIYIRRALKSSARRAAAGADKAKAGQLTDAMISGMIDDAPQQTEPEPDGGEHINPYHGTYGHDEPKPGGMLETNVAQKHEDEDKLFTASLYMDNPEDPKVYTPGLYGMEVDEFSQLLRMNAAKAATMEVTADETGEGLQLQGNENTPEPMQVFAHKAKETGNIPSREEYKRACYAVASEMLVDDDFENLSDKDMKDAMLARMHIEGLEGVYFPDDPEAAAKLKSLQEGIINNLLSTRGDNIPGRVREFLNGKYGLPGARDFTKRLDSELGALFKPEPEVEALRNAEKSMWEKKRKETGSTFSQLFYRYKQQFMAETGLTDREVIGPDSQIQAFKNWYFQPGGVYEQTRKDYIAEAKAYIEQAAIEAVVDYRMNGGEDWGEEQALMQSAMQKAFRGMKGGGEWARWRSSYNANQAARAVEYRQQAKKYKPMLEGAQKRGKEEQAEKERAAAEEKERADWQKAEERKERHKQWEAEREKAEVKKSPYKGSVVAKMQVRPDGDENPTLTVPYDQYEEICNQLEVGDGGLVVSFGGSTDTYVVKPGNVKNTQMNGALYNARYGKKKLTPQQVKKIVNDHTAQIKFKKVTL